TPLARNALELTGAIARTFVQATTASDDAVGSPRTKSPTDCLRPPRHDLPGALASYITSAIRHRLPRHQDPVRVHPIDLGWTRSRAWDRHHPRRSSAAASTRAPPNRDVPFEHEG